MKEIQLTQGFVALVDDADYEWLNQYKWCAGEVNSGIVAMRRDRKQIVYMHRVIMGAKKGQLVDHKNRNKLDNQRRNLRFATIGQNNQNRNMQINNKSGYIGVSWVKRDKKWCATIRFDGVNRFLGYYDYPIDAAQAYDTAALQYFGPNARTNAQQDVS